MHYSESMYYSVADYILCVFLKLKCHILNTLFIIDLHITKISHCQTQYMTEQLIS